MRVLSSQEVSNVSGGALIVGQNLNLGLANSGSTGGQTSLVNRLLGNTGASVSTDKLVYLGRSGTSSSCGCGAQV